MHEKGQLYKSASCLLTGQSFPLCYTAQYLSLLKCIEKHCLHPIKAVFLVQITSSALSPKVVCDQLPFKDMFTLPVTCRLVPPFPLGTISGHYLMTFQAL